MKCPHCSNNQKVKDGMVCGSCRYQFTFNPKDRSSIRLTDGKFLSAIRAASQNGNTFYTRNQLYGAFCGKQKHPRVLLLVGGAIASLIAMTAFFSGVLPVAFLVTLVALVLIVQGLFGGLSVPSRGNFGEWIDRWERDGKPLEKMISDPSLHEPPPEWEEDDIYDYGVEQILIVQHDLLVDLFVLNGIHAERRVLVISESGYPQYLLTHARRFLDERADLPVYLLHDADAEGQAMASRVEEMDLPLDGRQIIDLGMMPEDFRAFTRSATYRPDRAAGRLPVDLLSNAFLNPRLEACFSRGSTFKELRDEGGSGAVVMEFGSDFG